MLKWWIALIIGIVSLCIGWTAGRISTLTLLMKAKILLEDVDKELAELKEVADAIGRWNPGTDNRNIPGGCGGIRGFDPQAETNSAKEEEC